MTIYWPRRSAGLPPGQRLMHDMPRFTDDPFRPPPDLPACAVTDWKYPGVTDGVGVGIMPRGRSRSRWG